MKPRILSDAELKARDRRPQGPDKVVLPVPEIEFGPEDPTAVAVTPDTPAPPEIKSRQPERWELAKDREAETIEEMVDEWMGWLDEIGRVKGNAARQATAEQWFPDYLLDPRLTNQKDLVGLSKADREGARQAFRNQVPNSALTDREIDEKVLREHVRRQAEASVKRVYHNLGLEKAVLLG